MESLPQFPEALSKKWLPSWITWGSFIVWMICMEIFFDHSSQESEEFFFFVLFGAISFLVIFIYGIGCSLLIDRMVHRFRLRPVLLVKAVMHYLAGALFGGLLVLNDWDQLLFLIVSPYPVLALLFFAVEEVRNRIRARQGG